MKILANIMLKLVLDPYANIVSCSENVASLLHLLHIFKCTLDYFNHGSKHYEP